jgi:hypothetical protein
MRITRRLAVALCFAVSFSLIVTASVKPPQKPETPHLDFVKEYVRELAEIERIHASGEEELKQGTENDVFSIMIHTCTLSQLELRSQIAQLRGMRLKAPYDDLIPTLAGFYKAKIDLYQRLIDISSAMLAGPKPGVDYGKLEGEVPQIRAKLDFIDESVFKATPLIFSTLIDMKPDSKNHASHLIITKAERDKLMETLNDSFGPKLDEKNPRYLVGSASVLRDYLRKDWKCSDEPWN